MLSTKNLLFVILFSLAAVNTFGQTYGKLFTQNEGDQKFGPYLVSVGVSSAIVDSLCSLTDSVLLFKLIDNHIVILNNKRNILFSQGKVDIDSTTVFQMYSIPVIKELLKNGNSKLTYIQQRDSVLTVSSGNALMEVGGACPPLCCCD